MVGTAKCYKRLSRSVLQRAASSTSTFLRASADGCSARKRLTVFLAARCPVFELYDYNNPANKCFQSPAINEATTGTLPSLPGCNPIVRGTQASHSSRRTLITTRGHSQRDPRT